MKIKTNEQFPLIITLTSGFIASLLILVGSNRIIESYFLNLGMISVIFTGVILILLKFYYWKFLKLSFYYTIGFSSVLTFTLYYYYRTPAFDLAISFIIMIYLLFSLKLRQDSRNFDSNNQQYHDQSENEAQYEENDDLSDELEALDEEILESDEMEQYELGKIEDMDNIKNAVSDRSIYDNSSTIGRIES